MQLQAIPIVYGTELLQKSSTGIIGITVKSLLATFAGVGIFEA
jgi:hypothetical protein